MSPTAKPMKPVRRVPGFAAGPKTPDVTPGAESRDLAPLTQEPQDGEEATASAPAVQEAQELVTTSAATQTTTELRPASPNGTGAKPDGKSRNGARDAKAPAAPPADITKPGGYRHQTNFRLYESEVNYLKRLRREFEDDEIKTDNTELVHAMIYAARCGELDPLEILRRWRKDLNEF